MQRRSLGPVLRRLVAGAGAQQPSRHRAAAAVRPATAAPPRPGSRRGGERGGTERRPGPGQTRASRPPAIGDLLETLDDPDDGLREAAARALGDLRAAVAVEPLRRRLASGPAGAGAQQSNSPRLVEPCEALLEALGDIGVASDEVVAVIRPFVEHERPLIRSAACRALLQLTGEAHWGEQLVVLLQHPQLQVRRAALMDLGAAGWRPALQPIATTLAENSLKLIALRGLVEQGDDPADPGGFRDCGGAGGDGCPALRA